jgi:hypothetical protein
MDHAAPAGLFYEAGVVHHRIELRSAFRLHAKLGGEDFR